MSTSDDGFDPVPATSLSHLVDQVTRLYETMHLLEDDERAKLAVLLRKESDQHIEGWGCLASPAVVHWYRGTAELVEGHTSFCRIPRERLPE